jgi:hypothetical protein
MMTFLNTLHYKKTPHSQMTSMHSGKTGLFYCYRAFLQKIQWPDVAICSNLYESSLAETSHCHATTLIRKLNQEYVSVFALYSQNNFTMIRRPRSHIAKDAVLRGQRPVPDASWSLRYLVGIRHTRPCPLYVL